MGQKFLTFNYLSCNPSNKEFGRQFNEGWISVGKNNCWKTNFQTVPQFWVSFSDSNQLINNSKLWLKYFRYLFPGFKFQNYSLDLFKLSVFSVLKYVFLFIIIELIRACFSEPFINRKKLTSSCLATSSGLQLKPPGETQIRIAISSKWLIINGFITKPDHHLQWHFANIHKHQSLYSGGRKHVQIVSKIDVLFSMALNFLFSSNLW